MSDNAVLKVLHTAAEMAPLAKQGGLGDVLGALPKFMCGKGVDARVALPMYPGMRETIEKYGCEYVTLSEKVHVALDWRVYSASVVQANVEGVIVYLLDQPELYKNPKIYPAVLNNESVLQFVFLSLAALELPGLVSWKPDIMHVHDWTAAILPIALRWHRHYNALATEYDVVLTIHNLAYQGLIDPSAIASWGLVNNAFFIDGMEFYGQANILKGGILASDAITTVSPHYSWNIQTQDEGFGLDGIFRNIRHKLRGIINGIDYSVWGAENDKALPVKFSALDMSGKSACRQKLLEHCGWSDDGKPIALFVGRLVQQKGVDIMLSSLEQLLDNSCRAVVIGSGIPQYEEWCHWLTRTYPDSFWCFTEFGDEIAHLAYAGADILLMPSLFEPCGLSQMIAMAYGTVPIVRSTGGLADSVIDFDSSPDGTGFMFSDYSTDELLQASRRAFEAYWNKERWSAVTRNAMKANFSWSASSDAYIDLYNNLRNGQL